MDDRHKMGYLGATSYVIGNIIGSGIFITPSTILRYTESVGLSLIVWVACAAIAILGSLCYIELGTSIREAGCDFAYICYVKWYAVAFSFMWVSCLMTYPSTIAIIMETFGQYLVQGLQQSYEIDEAMVPVAQKLFGISLLLLVTWMNFFELNKFAARFQIAATVAKLLACALIIVTGFYYLWVKGWNESLTNPSLWANSNYKAGDLMMGLYGGLYAYSGWDILNYGTGEIYRPRRNVPLALLSGLIIVALVYLAMNIAYFAVLDVETVKASNAVAALFSQRTLGSFSYAIPFLIGILLIGSLNSNLFSGSRYMYAAARQGHLPACFSCVNSMTDSPRVAIFAQSALAIAISFVGDLDKLVGYVMFGFWAQRIFTLIALLTIRYKCIPVHPEAIRIPLPCIVLFLAINIVLVIIPIVQEFEVTSLGIGICIVGFGLYFLLVHPTALPSALTHINDWSTFIFAIIFDGLPDLKPKALVVPPTPSSLVSSDSQQLLLGQKRSSFSLLSDDGVTDLHADEKNKLIRNGSSSGLRMW
ncbi:AAT-5 protein [Aphelenchoides avenae]|nr:AAT-5 protein [Aphelenchus avenae]